MSEWFGWLVMVVLGSLAAFSHAAMLLVVIAMPFAILLEPETALWLRVLLAGVVGVITWPLIPLLLWPSLVYLSEETADDWRVFRGVRLSRRDIASGGLAIGVVALCGLCLAPLVLALRAIQ